MSLKRCLTPVKERRETGRKESNRVQYSSKNVYTNIKKKEVIVSILIL